MSFMDDDLDFAEKTCERQAEEIASLKAQLDECKKDAERYHWLKDNDTSIGIHSYDHKYDESYYVHDADSAIDAAMAQKEEA